MLNSVELREGGLTFGPVDRDRKPDASISATADGWFAAVVDGDARGLRLSGDRRLATSIWESLHEAIVAPVPSRA
jgi:hypothetical protein